MPVESKSIFKQTKKKRLQLDVRRLQLIELGLKYFSNLSYDEVNLDEVANSPYAWRRLQPNTTKIWLIIKKKSRTSGNPGGIPAGSRGWRRGWPRTVTH